MFGLPLHTFLNACQRQRIKLDVQTFELKVSVAAHPQRKFLVIKMLITKTSKIATYELFILHWNKFICWEQGMNAKKVIL